MLMSGAVQALLLLALIAGGIMTEGAGDTLLVKDQHIFFRIAWWGDGGVEGYEVYFTAYEISSIYTFDASGRLTTLKVADARFTLERDTETAAVTPEVQSSSILPTSGFRGHLVQQDEAVEDAAFSYRRRHNSCTGCEETWDTLCDRSLVDMCYWADVPPYVFTKDAQISLLTMCSAFETACETSAGTACVGICLDGEKYVCVTHPLNDSRCSFNARKPWTLALCSYASTRENSLRNIVSDSHTDARTRLCSIFPECVLKEPTPAPDPAPAPEPVLPPTPEPVEAATLEPVLLPTPEPILPPTAEPVLATTPEPILAPNREPTTAPTLEPIISPPPEATPTPSPELVLTPTPEPTTAPTVLSPTLKPDITPTPEPNLVPTLEPVLAPTLEPIVAPTPEPVLSPTP